MGELEFNEVLEAKRHKEILTALMSIYEKLSNIPPDSGKEIKKVLMFLEQSLKQPKNDEIVEELKKLSNTWISSIEELKPVSTKEWTFKINRNSQGFIESVNAKRNQ